MRNLIILLIVFFSFQNNAEAQAQWQEWQKSACYSNIEFRVQKERKQGKRTEWNIQFRNKYSTAVTFNYAITEDSQDFLTNLRKTLNPNEVSPPVSFFTQTADFYVLVDKLSFSLHGGELVPCDE